MKVSFQISLWDRRRHNIATISTTDEEFLKVLKKWAEELGHTIEIRRLQSEEHGGPEHK